MTGEQRRFRVLVTDEINPDGLDLLHQTPEIEVIEKPTRPLAEVIQEIASYDAMIGRSATRVSAELLEAGTNLKVIGRAGVGVDNVDLDKATELGIAVINAPGGNTVAVAELVFGVVISYLRHIHVAVSEMREGGWPRSKLGGTELRSRNLVIIGLGRIGGEVARRARAFGLRIGAYDPYVSANRFEELHVERYETLDEALQAADIVTLHVPLTNETSGMIGRRELGLLKASSMVLNYARGGIIDDDALLDALRNGSVGAAALDVFASEPLAKDHPFRQLPNVMLTPHLGASTVEAQRNVALEACAAVRDALLTGDLSAALNAVGVGGPELGEMRPLLQLAEKLGRLGQALLPSGLSGLELRYTGSRAEAARPLLLAALQGAMENVVDQRVNLVNAQHVADSRGIETAWTQVKPKKQGGEEIEILIDAGGRALRVGGTIIGDGYGLITRIGAYRVDVAPRGTLIVLRNRDVPGVIGRVGTIIGAAEVNIAEYHQARLQAGGEALAAIQVDSSVTTELLEQLCALPEVLDARQVRME
ncbi:MAG: phosphoglycerate dehydrogenase [Gemmatimonadota bacterium]|jgi:D-3-phosphoglycerate dehydrogenase|nr:phosphoglycerate dehydrogenase [Gemmatimonadota bacterium]